MNHSSCLKPLQYFGPSDGDSLTREAHDRSRSAAPMPQSITFLSRSAQAKPQGCNTGAQVAMWLGSQRFGVSGHKSAQTNFPKNFSSLSAYCLDGKLKLFQSIHCKSLQLHVFILPNPGLIWFVVVAVGKL